MSIGKSNIFNNIQFDIAQSNRGIVGRLSYSLYLGVREFRACVGDGVPIAAHLAHGGLCAVGGTGRVIVGTVRPEHMGMTVAARVFRAAARTASGRIGSVIIGRGMDIVGGFRL